MKVGSVEHEPELILEDATSIRDAMRRLARYASDATEARRLLLRALERIPPAIEAPESTEPRSSSATLQTPPARLRRPQSARRSAKGGSGGSSGLTNREADMTEYVSGVLGGKIKAIICEWWTVVGEGAASTEHLESSTIYERLTSEGVEVPDHAMSEILVELAKGGQIKLTMDSRRCRDPRKYGSMTIHSVGPGLCS
jgi:hypothetical protein